MSKTSQLEQELRARQRKYKGSKSVDNSASYAGSPMYFRCPGCDNPHGICVPESYISKPEFCAACAEAKRFGIEL